MKKIYITVAGISYEVKFSFGSIRLFLEMYGETKYSAIDKYLPKLVITDASEPSFEFFDILGNLILSGVLNAAEEEVSITASRIVDAVMLEPELVAQMIAAFMNVVPKETEQRLGKLKARKSLKK